MLHVFSPGVASGWVFQLEKQVQQQKTLKKFLEPETSVYKRSVLTRLDDGVQICILGIWKNFTPNIHRKKLVGFRIPGLLG